MTDAVSLSVKIATAMGLRRCPHAPARGPIVLCGCAPDRCDQREADFPGFSADQIEAGLTVPACLL